MIEKVARCMAGHAWGDLPRDEQQFWLLRARAAIEAMRYATDAMASYAKHRNPGVSNDLAKSVWLCMVDEALAEKIQPRKAAMSVDTFNYTYSDAVEWQPIETAPKDGTDILATLLYRDGGDGGIQTIRWHEPWGQWVMSGCLIGIQNNAKDDENADPTHWMPLPSPPKR